MFKVVDFKSAQLFANYKPFTFGQNRAADSSKIFAQ